MQYQQEMHATFLCLFIVLSHSHGCVRMALSSQLELSVNVDNLLLASVDLLDLSLHDIHLQWVKGQKYKGKFNI